MTDSAPETVLRRKAEAGRGQSGGGALTPEKALGLALAKAAQEMMALPLRVAAARFTRMSLAEITECLPERALIALIEGPAEGLGLMALAPEALASLIEMQTTGRVGAGPVAARRPTRTDAAMSAPFIDRVLGAFEERLAADPAIAWAGGFRYASHLEDPRPIGLLLEDGGYRVFRSTLGFGGEGGRQGDLVLALPAEGRGPPPLRADGGEALAVGAEAAAEWGERMEAAILGSRALLEAVLDRVTLPLSGVLALKPGDMLPVPAGALGRVRVEGRGRRFVAQGKLGLCQGSLAVRLLAAPEGEPDRAAGLAALREAPEGGDAPPQPRALAP